MTLIMRLLDGKYVPNTINGSIIFVAITVLNYVFASRMKK